MASNEEYAGGEFPQQAAEVSIFQPAFGPGRGFVGSSQAFGGGFAPEVPVGELILVDGSEQIGFALHQGEQTTSAGFVMAGHVHEKLCPGGMVPGLLFALSPLSAPETVEGDGAKDQGDVDVVLQIAGFGPLCP